MDAANSRWLERCDAWSELWREGFRFVKSDRHDCRESTEPYLRMARVRKLRYYGAAKSGGVSEQPGRGTGGIPGSLQLSAMNNELLERLVADKVCID